LLSPRCFLLFHTYDVLLSNFVLYTRLLPPLYPLLGEGFFFLLKPVPPIVIPFPEFWLFILRSLVPRGFQFQVCHPHGFSQLVLRRFPPCLGTIIPYEALLFSIRPSFQTCFLFLCFVPFPPFSFFAPPCCRCSLTWCAVLLKYFPRLSTCGFPLVGLVRFIAL